MSINIRLQDGRDVCVHEFGDPAGRPVVFFHGGGLGATGVFASVCDAAARALHFRILAPDRPGLGGSSPYVGRKVRDWPDDIEQMANALHIGTFPVVAHSGGAPYALVCAGILQKRVSSVHLTSTMVSRPMLMQDNAVPFTAKLKTLFFAAVPDFVLASMFMQIRKGLQNNPEKTGQAFLRRLPPCERHQLATPGTQAFLQANVLSATRQGTASMIGDLHLILEDWGFPLKTVQQPVTIWHGENDATALPQTARTLAGKIFSAEVHMIPEAGHLTTWLCHTRDILGGIG